MVIPDQDMAPAWQRQSREGAERDSVSSLGMLSRNRNSLIGEEEEKTFYTILFSRKTKEKREKIMNIMNFSLRIVLK